MYSSMRQWGSLPKTGFPIVSYVIRGGSLLLMLRARRDTYYVLDFSSSIAPIGIACPSPSSHASLIPRLSAEKPSFHAPGADRSSSSRALICRHALQSARPSSLDWVQRSVPSVHAPFWSGLGAWLFLSLHARRSSGRTFSLIPEVLTSLRPRAKCCSWPSPCVPRDLTEHPHPTCP